MNELQPNHFEFQGWLISVLPTKGETWLFSCLPPDRIPGDEPLSNDRFYRTAEEAIVAAQQFVARLIYWGRAYELLDQLQERGSITAAERSAFCATLVALTNLAPPT